MSRGLYLHIPFCLSKCPYCDFYSLPFREDLADAYEAALLHRLEEQVFCYDTVYFGGGTPNLMGSKRLNRILKAVRLAPEAEVTLEANPRNVNYDFFAALFEGGFNRLSMGLQSADMSELKALGRQHSRGEAETAVLQARAAGFSNISLDLMLGVPGANPGRLHESIEFVTALPVSHVSCYMLKVEENTPFFHMHLNLPTEDETCDLYLQLVEELKEKGFPQYEISNFSRPGRESRHNLKYWRCEEYLGLGPAAHSYISGKRFFFPRDLTSFLEGAAPVFDSEGGSFSEYAMLKLRLTEGLQEEECTEKYGSAPFRTLLNKARTLPKNLLNLTPAGLSLTPQGFLLSNTILSHLL